MAWSDDLEVFLAIVEKGSQSAAARHLQRSLQSVGRSLASLEAGVGVPLIRRTTRKSHPTEAGLAFYSRVKPAVVEIHEARKEAVGFVRELSGRLRVASPALFARAFVMPTVNEFLTRFPRVEVELKSSDRQADLLDEELDIAIRIRQLPDSTLKARRLGELRIVAFGARTYFDRRGRPRHPFELSGHDCIVRTIDARGEPWPFRIDGKPQAVRVRGRFRTDDSSAILAAVAQGFGIGFGPFWQVRELLDSGTVEVVLQDFETDRMPIHAVLPPTRTQPAKVRLFMDLLAARLRKAGL